MKSTPRIAVIGAGPYGLAAAAHLQAAGADTVVFGRVMEFWRCHMPAGMLLRSPWRASHIADPLRRSTLDEYERAGGAVLGRPIPIEDYIRYGEWFRQRAVGNVDSRFVRRLEADSTGFRLRMEDGDELRVDRVVGAAGLKDYAYLPPELAALPRPLVFHACEHPALGVFAGRRVIVIGGGQSAIESAALLAEGGAEVELIARRRRFHWLAGEPRLRIARAARRLYPPSEIGPFPVNWTVELPDLFRKLGPRIEARIARRVLRPSAAHWLIERFRPIPRTTGRNVVAASASAGEVVLRLDDGSQRRAQHVLLATGYRVDISRHAFLPAEVLRRVRQVAGSPVLSPSFESTQPGLHFIGAASVFSFGPLMRFVWGAGYTGRALARGLGQ